MTSYIEFKPSRPKNYRGPHEGAEHLADNVTLSPTSSWSDAVTAENVPDYGGHGIVAIVYNGETSPLFIASSADTDPGQFHIIPPNGGQREFEVFRSVKLQMKTES